MNVLSDSFIWVLCLSRKLVSERTDEDPLSLSKLTTPTNQDYLKTPTKAPLPTTSTPTKLYMTNVGMTKATLRPTKSLSPPMVWLCCTFPQSHAAFITTLVCGLGVPLYNAVPSIVRASFLLLCLHKSSVLVISLPLKFSSLDWYLNLSYRIKA